MYIKSIKAIEYVLPKYSTNIMFIATMVMVAMETVHGC